MQINTEGLVLMEKSVGESDRLVTVLTRDEGVIRAFAQQAKRLQNRKLSSTQLLSYSRLSVYKGRDKYIINDAWPIESFFDLRLDMERLSLAQYFCELAVVLAPEEAEAGDFLRLMLNSLHFLAKGLRPGLQLKAVVEMRMLALAGYMPDLVCCRDCGCYEADTMFFLPRSGGIVCGDCFSPASQQEEPAIPLPRGVMTALRHTIYADFDKLFSFRLSDDGLRLLADASEQYLLSTVQQRFTTLDFYHQMTRP